MGARINEMRENLEKALNDPKKPWAQYFDLIEKHTSVKRLYIFLGVVSFFAILLGFGAAGQLISNTVGFVFPAYMSMTAIETSSKEDDTKWLTYWVVFSFFSTLDYFSNFLTSWLPLYWLLKCMFFIWCFAPIENNGSNVVYKMFIRPRFLKHKETVKEIFDNAKDEASKFISEQVLKKSD